MIVKINNNLTESAITDNNERTMDGLLAKKYLIRGAQRDSNIEYPNKEWGYGKLNIYEVFNSLRRV